MVTEDRYILIMLALSVVFLLLPFVWLFLRQCRKKAHRLSANGTGISAVLLISGCMILSVWVLRFAVGCYYIDHPKPNEPQVLTKAEEFFNSLIHAMQTFSMDEDYTSYITDGKQMMAGILGVDSIWEKVYGIYAAVLNAAAPVVGGALIFEILASVFPAVRLFIARCAIWHPKYYFSELNEASLELAKSILQEPCFFLIKPVLVFTDVYGDDSSEKSMELAKEAKRIGAICVRDDLSHVRKNRLGGKKLFLIDQAMGSNLQTLASLYNSGTFLKRAEIYHFVQDEAYAQVERSVRKALKKRWKIQNDDDHRLPVFIPVKSHRNLVADMLVEVPLYEPLIQKPADPEGIKDLTVTVLGTGRIGMEMVLTTYWMGQLPDHRLTINVVSLEPEAAFWDKLRNLNPQIQQTMDPDSELLNINEEEKAPAYCKINYIECNVDSESFADKLKNELLGTTDYFLVALGSDAQNIDVANRLRKQMGLQQLEEKTQKNTVICYVVYNSDVAQTLNADGHSSVSNIYMHAVGCREDVYSARLVFMTDYFADAQDTHNAYLSRKRQAEQRRRHRARLNDDYKYWSNLARTMHVKYKMYAAYAPHTMKGVLFAGENADNMQLLREEYKAYVKVKPEKVDAEHQAVLNKLAWLEHRRWNAFTRVMGFQWPEDFEKYATPGVSDSYKQMELKLHPCLAECDRNGIRKKASSNLVDTEGKTSEEIKAEEKELLEQKIPTFTFRETETLDALDRQMALLAAGRYITEDLKIYDYPD